MSYEIHESLLGHIDDKYDKRTGSFLHMLTKPTAIKLGEVDLAINTVEGKLYLENLSDDELELRIKERTGLVRKAATYAVGDLTIVGNGVVNAGDLFETESGIRFEVIETVTIVTEGVVEVQCTTSGVVGNVPANQIVHIPVTLDGITSVYNASATYDGFEKEIREDYLIRYYERIQTPATSGNKAHYKNWAKEVSGVGDARVISLWNGPNTVKVILIDADRLPASTDIVEDVQNYIDPGVTGLGDGTAPIGAFCTVVCATGKEIDVSASVTLHLGYVIEDVLGTISENIREYLKDIAFIDAYVSYAQIGSILFNSDGVKDYTDLLVNGDTDNVSVTFDEVAILGGCSID